MPRASRRLLAAFLVAAGLGCLFSALASMGSLPPLAALALETTTPVAAFGAVTPGGTQLDEAVQLVVTSELAWRLWAAAVALPAGITLEWSADGGATWHPFSADATVILDGQEPAWPSSRQLDYDLRLTVGWSVPPGSYSLPIAYQAQFTDQDPPVVVLFLIDDGARFTRLRDVTLTLEATDPSGVGSMRFSGDGEAFGDWQAYALTSAYTLPEGDGPKHIWVQARDRAGNVSAAVVAGIILDTVPPAITDVAVVAITAGGATVTWRTDELASSQVEWGKTTAYGSWSPLLPGPVTQHSVPLAGLEPFTVYHYRVHSVDRAGNASVAGPFEFMSGLLAPVNATHRITGRHVWIEWSPPPAGNPGHFRVWRRDVLAGETGFTDLGTTTDLAYRDMHELPTGAAAKYHREYYVTAYYGDLESPPSNLVTVRRD